MKIENYLERVELRKAFSEVLALSSEGNRYLEDTQPWVEIKNDRERTQRILYHCANLCGSLAILASPFIPNASQRVWDQLNLQGKVDSHGSWDKTTETLLKSRHRINKPSILFKKLEDEYVEKFKRIVADAPDLAGYFK